MPGMKPPSSGDRRSAFDIVLYLLLLTAVMSR
jgi:hypothetical protein